MKEKLLIEILEELTSPQNNDKKTRNALLKRCLNASRLERENFLKELSQLLCYSPDVYLPTLTTFISHVRDEPLWITPHQAISLPNFISMLITVVIAQNLHYSDIPSFGKLLSSCVELLWRGPNGKPFSSTGDKGSKFVLQTTRDLFTAILNMKGVLNVLISGAAGHQFLKRVLFDFNMINEIEREDLLRAVEMVGSLVEKCLEDSRCFSIYKACNALLETFGNHKSGKMNFLPPDLQVMVELDDKESRAQRCNSTMASLSNQDEKHLKLLGMEFPEKSSDLPKFLRSLEQRKINSFKDLIGFLPCEHCQKRALIYFSPDKYSSIMENVENEYNPPEYLFRLPFEFNDTDRLGPWDILLSEDAIKDMQEFDAFTVEAVMKKLVHISSGAWYKYGLQCKVSSHTIPVYEVELPNNDGLRILWQVDCGFSTRNYSLTQLVKVWAITSSQEQIDKTLDNLAIVHHVYNAKHKDQCAIKNMGKNNIILPRSFEDNEGTKSTDKDLYNSEMDNERLLEVHKMLVTNKFVPLSKNLFKLLVWDETKTGVPTFQVSKIEYEIINNPTSAIVIGRSGTGKTTCIVFRLLASYLTNQLYKTPSSYGNNRNSYKRQIFITVSEYLRERVKDHFNHLQDSAVLTENKMSKDDFNEYARKKKEKGGSDEVIDDDTMHEEGEDKEERPKSFRLLKDHHFPLFITYEEFSEMLQKTYGIDAQKSTIKQKFDARDDVYNNDAYGDREENFRLNYFENISKSSWAHFVDYDLFKKKYWHRFSDSHRKNLDCELVYSEFTIIKGTNPEVDYLLREEYRAISTKKYPMFCHNRDEIYDLFEQYEQMKARNYDYDSVDRSLAILRAAKTKKLGGPHIHEVYIDECQDNQIMDINLILKLFDQADSIFMAGDIAQCISPGSSFRFQDLSTLMYKWECNRNQYNTTKPKQFELNINYRSHNGILQLASSVIDLLWKFFPDSIDKLPQECSEVYGPQPLIFKGFDAETFLFDVFSGDEQVGDLIEFGASQVIIVRNEETKQRIYDLNGDDIGLVLTVFEAKGMEFNDVLLYNFFKDSPANKKWRLILGTQTFSHEKHYILSSELKYLYVALTRARENLWIFDENDESSEAFQTYWNQRKLVKVIQDVKEISNLTLAKRSRPSEWNKEGKKYFEQRKYKQAITCFEKSGNEVNRKLANAYYCQQIARDSFINGSDEKTVKSKYVSAAQAFEECSRPVRAASCYEDIGMYKEAGRSYADGKMFESAAQCYFKAKIWEKSGEYFEMVHKYNDAITAYKNGRFYKKVISLIQRHGQGIDEKNSRLISRLVNIHYCRKNDKEMSKKALSILSTEKEQIELLRDHAPEKLMEFCEERGQFRNAAKDLRDHGKFEEAANMFIRSDENEDIIESLQCFLHLCRVNVLINTMTDKSLSTLRELLVKASETVSTVYNIKSQSSKKLLRTEQWNILMMEFHLYIAYFNEDINKVQECIQFFRKHKKVDIEFYAVNIWLKILQQSDIPTKYWHEWLQYLLRLCELSFPFISSHRNIVNIEEIYNDFEKIFFVIKVENREQKRKISLDNPLIDKIHNNIRKDDIVDVEEIMDNWHVYDVNIIHQAISQFLASYISKLIFKTDQNGRNFPNISSFICSKFPYCQKPDCRYHHVKPSPSILHQRLTLACLQYTVIQQLNVLYSHRLLKEEQSKEVRRLQRLWAETLIRIHIRYQSPQTSCSEITHMMLAKLSKYARNGLINLAHKIWLDELIKNPGNFAIMLKCVFVIQQLRDKWSIDKFYWVMSKTKKLLHPNNLPLGFDYYCGQAIPVGKQLSLFFYYLHSNYVIRAIYHINKFIDYTIDNNELVYMDEFEAFCDFVSLMEFKTSLVFTAGTKFCDFCLPKSYLINYFDALTAKPLIQSQHVYKRENYLAEIKNSLDQIEQLLDLLIYNDEQYYLTIILRLIRLLVLIGRNEYTFAPNVFNLFKYLNNKVSSINLKKYLEKGYMKGLMEILKDDLKETGCDSLIIVYYNWGGISRFTELERSGVTMLKYNSIEGFHSSLQKIKSQIVTEEVITTVTSTNQLLSQQTNDNKHNHDSMLDSFIVSDKYEEYEEDANKIAEETLMPTTEIQTWFREIQNSPEAQEAAKRIQRWFCRVQDREKSRQAHYDPTLDKVYNDVRDFCQVAMKNKGKLAVYKYHMFLKGPMVDMIVGLIKLQSRMDVTKNKLQKKINDRSTDEEKLEYCLNLEDDLKYIHDYNVKSALDSLSITENKLKHEEADFKWLKIELQKAKDIIEEVHEWMEECKKL